jgi:hypothetical protein
VIDLRGRTTLRDTVRLMYHAHGVVCPVTFMMHLAAAVPMKATGLHNRPCVVVAGGREPSHWEAYPHHQFIHTIGVLDCCATGGCWKSRTVPLGDGDEKDNPDHLCLDVAPGPLPRCMDMIPAEEVIRRVELYLQRDGKRTIVTGHTFKTRKRVSEAGFDAPLNNETASEALASFVRYLPTYPGGFAGRGIVICGGGVRYFTNAWVCVQMLRRHGCRLPVQLWHLGPKECDDRMKELMGPLGVECVDALEIRRKVPARILNGWEIKPYAVLNCPFREVLLLDADNVPLVDPEFLFETPQFRQEGAIFWPDFGRLAPTRDIWRLCEVAYRDEPEFETGQLVVDKERCWAALRLTMWMNEQSDFFYRHIHGDKETFHMAFRRAGKGYAMPETPIHALRGTMCQHDFEGRRVFQHRNLAKWSLHDVNPVIDGFLMESECREHLDQLRALWDGQLRLRRFILPSSSEALEAVNELLNATFEYHRVGHDRRPLSFLPNGVVGKGAGRCEQLWDLVEERDQLVLRLSSETDLTCELVRSETGVWKGRWLIYERMPVELIPLEDEGAG